MYYKYFITFEVSSLPNDYIVFVLIKTMLDLDFFVIHSVENQGVIKDDPLKRSALKNKLGRRGTKQ
jgi:hypothetical protein